MNFEKFKKLINLMQKQSDAIDSACKLGIDLIEYHEDYHKAIDILLEAVFTENGADLIFWWLFDDCEKSIIDNTVVYDVLDIEDFYNYLNKAYLQV